MEHTDGSCFAEAAGASLSNFDLCFESEDMALTNDDPDRSFIVKGLPLENNLDLPTTSPPLFAGSSLLLLEISIGRLRLIHVFTHGFIITIPTENLCRQVAAAALSETKDQ